MKKAVWGSLAAALLLGGCSDSGKKPADAAGATPDGKKKISLNWYVIADNNAQLPSPDKDFVKQAIEKKFNVDLKIQHMSFGPDYQSKVNLLISSGQSPDMFFMGGRESNKYILDKVVTDMSKYVTPKTMPNYFKYWTNETELKQYQVQGAFGRAPVPFARTQYTSYYIRKDWLDKLNLKMPETYDQMIEVMKAFTFNDPDGNGKNDTYGLTAAGNGANFGRDFPAWYQYGRPAGFILDGDKFIDSASDIKMKEILEDTKKLLAMKVVDPDWYLNKTGLNVEKASQGKAGIILSSARDIAFDNSPSSLQKKTIDVTGVKTVDWQPFHPWASTGVNSEAVPGIPFLFSSKAPEENLQRTAEIMDWLFGEEGYLLTHYGQEGTHYKKEGSKITIISEAYKKDISDNGNFLKIYGAFTPEEPFVLKLEVIDPKETDRDRKIVEKLRTYKYVPSPGTSLTPPQGFDLAAFRAKMNAYHAKILFEEKDASNWPKYREELINKYQGKEIFDNYAKQVSEALGKTYTFVAANP
ncbi:extracellular solute-binding protein [Paenibacillus sp. CC-CFT747]|nr:extracellular solute-binding protein [Paenibacillus sp. CC-CFT747]